MIEKTKTEEAKAFEGQVKKTIPNLLKREIEEGINGFKRLVRGQVEKTIPDLGDKIKGFKTLVRHHDAEKTNEKVELSEAELRKAELRYYEAQLRKKLRELKLGVVEDKVIFWSWVLAYVVLPAVTMAVKGLWFFDEGSSHEALALFIIFGMFVTFPLVLRAIDDEGDKLKKIEEIKEIMKE